VLVLALETSTRRGSAALVESGVLLAEAWHDEANAHAERLLDLIDDVFGRACRNRSQLDRVAVGRGPGAFTGLRIGLALAQGIASGLGIPAVGIGSLRAIAAAVPQQLHGNRWPILDARRGDVFLACYRADGSELVSPRVVPMRQTFETVGRLREALGEPSSCANWIVGQYAGELSRLPMDLARCGCYESDRTAFPTAAAVGQLASSRSEDAPASPEYLRDADAVLPMLPPCPLARPAEEFVSVRNRNEVAS
jgi:tRNA threonylcarbamoyl adenosine modification protein YeaZ